jgi:hypothetical protein
MLLVCSPIRNRFLTETTLLHGGRKKVMKTPFHPRKEGLLLFCLPDETTPNPFLTGRSCPEMLLSLRLGIE